MGEPEAPTSRQHISLEGSWRFRLDPNGFGGWLNQLEDDGAGIDLPGSTDEAAKGYRTSTRPLSHLGRQHEYVGAAWYRRDIVIPEEWSEKRLVLFLERPHWETSVWLDQQYLGRQNSLSVPHRYELGHPAPGEHELTIRVDNTVKIGVGDALAERGHFNLAHAVTDHTQTNWNGIVGRIELQATDRVWVEDVQIYPDPEIGSAKVVLTVCNDTGGTVAGQLSIEASCRTASQHHACPPATLPFSFGEEQLAVETTYRMDQAMRWDEFSPALYTLAVQLEASGDVSEYRDSHQVQFGMRTFQTSGRQCHLNDRPVFLRGTLECCIFPLTGYPPTDVTAWRRILEIAATHGLNHLRFHSWCPPEAAFTAADELGFMLQVEGPLWAAFGSDPQVDSFARAEGDRILKIYGNHPSFCLMAVSNEPSGAEMESVLGGIIDRWRDQDPRRIYTSGAGWPSIPENDYHCTTEPRSYQWQEGLSARFNAEPLATDFDYTEFVRRFEVPVVSHEIGQWTSYPDYHQIAKYTGVLKPHNLEHFRHSLAENGMLEKAEVFAMASGKLQTLLYKEEIESALRTPEFGGFQLLDLHDYPGQGTALVGVLDAFWDNKGYVTPKAFREFCAETVLLACMPKVVWQTHETFEAEVRLAHFGPEALTNPTVTWRLEETDGEQIATGVLHPGELSLGSGIPIGAVSVPLGDVPAPSHLVFKLSLEGTQYRNQWDLWLYPTHLELTNDVHITKQLDTASLAVLREGGSVLLLPPAEAIHNDIPLGFTTPFWNTVWTEGQPPHTMGVLCDPNHPALEAFPTQFHSNWHWWELVHRAKCLLLDGLGYQPDPIVQVIDDWTTNRKLALVIEAKVETGKVLVCSADLHSELDERPVARQLLHSLLSYMQSTDFDPEVGIGLADLNQLGDLVS